MTRLECRIWHPKDCFILFDVEASFILFLLISLHHLQETQGWVWNDHRMVFKKSKEWSGWRYKRNSRTLLSVRVKEDVYFLKVRKEVSVCLSHALLAQSLSEDSNERQRYREKSLRTKRSISKAYAWHSYNWSWDIQTGIVFQFLRQEVSRGQRRWERKIKTGAEKERSSSSSSLLVVLKEQSLRWRMKRGKILGVSSCRQNNIQQFLWVKRFPINSVTWSAHAFNWSSSYDLCFEETMQFKHRNQLKGKRNNDNIDRRKVFSHLSCKSKGSKNS